MHFVHIFEWMTGSKAVAATAMTNRLHCPGIEGEDIASAILRLDSGALVTLDMAWCADAEELAVHGTKGSVHYRSNRWLAVSSNAGSFHGRVVDYSGAARPAFGGLAGEEQVSEVIPPAFGDAANPLNQHRAFLEAARDGKPAPVSIESGVHDMRVVQAVYDLGEDGTRCKCVAAQLRCVVYSDVATPSALPDACAIQTTDLHRHYEIGGNTVRAVDGVSIAIGGGEFVRCWVRRVPENPRCWGCWRGWTVRPAGRLRFMVRIWRACPVNVWRGTACSRPG